MEHLSVTSRYRKTLNPLGIKEHSVPEWTTDIDNPFLHGLYAPTTDEITSSSLEVIGEIPHDLFGCYFRNGPNPKFKPSGRYHWFDGDGMIWGIHFEGGKASYSNRWIETRCLREEERKGKTIWPGVLGPFDFRLPISPIKETANTDLFYRNKTLYATWYETGQVYAIDPKTLNTKRNETFDLPMAAHSRVDPNTGDLIFFGFSMDQPYLWYGVLGCDGKLHRIDVELPGPRLPHDIGISANYSILHDFPMIFDPEKVRKTGIRVPRFRPDQPTRFGVLPRFGANEDIKWFECKPCYMLHVVNCYEEGDELVQIGCRTDDPTLKIDPADGELAGLMAYLKLSAHLYEWRFNLKSGKVIERTLSDVNAEFPTINRAYMGRKNRWAYLQLIPYETPPTFDALLKYDVSTGSYTQWKYGQGVFGSEAFFAARQGALAEDDGYVITYVTNVNDWGSKCLIFDAQDISQGPICQVCLPHRLPGGFHALWVPGHEM